VRIALVSPYSWSYPGGVTRHIEALADELDAAGHETRILAPFDPDDGWARPTHRGARPQPLELPPRLVALGRTMGFPANGAISNLAATPDSVLALWRELRGGGYDVVHIHEPIVPLVGWYGCSCATLAGIPLVGTFHSFSENALTNGIGIGLGARRRMNRLHARIAVSEAAAWTGRRFFGGRYTIIPNGVHVGAPVGEPNRESEEIAAPLRVLFIGQAVERKGLPVLLRAFEALREQVPATLTLVGVDPQDAAPLLLDGRGRELVDRGIRALGKVSEERKAAELARAQVLCAPSLGGESFGMVLTEAFAAGTPVVTSDIAGYRDVVRDGVDGILAPRGDARELAQALRLLALEPRRREAMAGAARERAERFAWPQVAAEVAEVYEQARAVGRASTRLRRTLAHHGLAPADLLPAVPAQQLPSLEPALVVPPARRALRLARRGALAAVSLGVLLLALVALRRIGVGPVVASIVASSPGLIGAGLGLMCLAMFVRGLAWHTILRVAPTWRRARLRDALQGTFIGVLMSATLPVRLGEPARALIVARRIGRARETLPVVLGTMVSQTLLNLLALALLGLSMLCGAPLLHGQGGALLVPALVPLGALMVVLLVPVLVPHSVERSRGVRVGGLRSLLVGARRALLLVREGLGIFRRPRQAAVATGAQFAAWGLQCASCWLLLMALGLDQRVGLAGAAGVLFAVNVTAAVPATPANVGVFQAACVAVLSGAYHVSTPDAIAYGIILQAVELATAVLMGLPALVNEGLSWREVRLRTLHATPVRLPERERAESVSVG
jgi:phosphatidyl-myo-inositol alpha-mannosyltransferase